MIMPFAPQPADDLRPVAGWMPVYTSLRDAIVGHRIPPGTKLPEDEIATIYSVSRTIVRAALQALGHDRLVTLEPNRGAFVSQPSKREAREIFEARSLVEPHVAMLAAGNANADQVAMLRRHIIEEHEAAHAQRDSEAIMLSARFHIAIAEIADHAILTSIVTDLVSRSSLIVALYWRRRDTTCESHAHEALVDAIGSGRGDDAAALMQSHLVDLVSGLDLAPTQVNEELRLANVLKP